MELLLGEISFGKYEEKCEFRVARRLKKNRQAHALAVLMTDEQGHYMR
jgi:hypothetical protein